MAFRKGHQIEDVIALATNDPISGMRRPARRRLKAKALADQEGRPSPCATLQPMRCQPKSSPWGEPGTAPRFASASLVPRPFGDWLTAANRAARIRRRLLPTPGRQHLRSL